MKKHTHNWHFVRIYFKNPFDMKHPDVKVATFICDCGLFKEVVVREVKPSN